MQIALTSFKLLLFDTHFRRDHGCVINRARLNDSIRIYVDHKIKRPLSVIVSRLELVTAGQCRLIKPFSFLAISFINFGYRLIKIAFTL